MTASGTTSREALEARARRAAKRVGLIARKSRWRIGTVDNLGEFAVIDPFSNAFVYGLRYDASAEDVIEYCGAG
jgi:hypothetical protein